MGPTNTLRCLSSRCPGLKATASGASQARPSPTRLRPPGRVKIAASKFQNVLCVPILGFPTSNRRLQTYETTHGMYEDDVCTCRAATLRARGVSAGASHPHNPVHARWGPLLTRSPRSDCSAGDKSCPIRDIWPCPETPSLITGRRPETLLNALRCPGWSPPVTAVPPRVSPVPGGAALL